MDLKIRPKQFETNDNVSFIISEKNPLYQAGIFKLLDEKTPIPIRSELFRYMVDPIDIPKQLLPELIYTILPLCIPHLKEIFSIELIHHILNSFEQKVSSNYLTPRLLVQFIISQELELIKNYDWIFSKLKDLVLRNSEENREITYERRSAK